MIDFFHELAERSVDETSKSERGSKNKASTRGNAKNINLNVTYEQDLCSMFGMLATNEKSDTEEFSKEGKKMIVEAERKMKLFQSVTLKENIEFDDIDLAVDLFTVGCIYASKSNYLYIAIEHFEKVMELIKGKEMHRKAILIAIRVRIKLSEIFANLQQPEKHYLMLEQAMELYIKYTNEEDKYPDPIYLTVAVDHPEEQKKDPKDMLLDFHIKTLEGLEKLYDNQCTKMHKFTKHVHNLLNKQLIKVISTGNKPSLFWAHASISLISYFFHHNRFMEAKIHIAAADYVRRAYKLKFKDQTYSVEEYQNYKHLHAITNIYWGAYGNNLLSFSKERLINGESYEAINMKSESFAKSQERPLIFVDLEKELEENSKITHTYVSSLNDAKVVFKNILKNFNTALTIFDAKDIFWYHVDIILQICTAYKNYAFFVGNRNEKINVTEQQIKYLKTAINSLTLKLTRDNYIKHYKQLYVALATAYSTLLDMTYEKFVENKDVTDEMKMELKQLTKNTLDNYKLYIKEI